MKDNFHTTRKIIVRVVMFAVLLAGYLYLTHLISLTSERTEIISKETEVLLEKERELISLNRLIENTKKDRANIETIFVKKENIVQFLDFLEELGKGSHTTLKINSIDTVSDKDKKDTIKLALESSGSFREIYAFILLIENSPYDMIFDKLYLQNVFSFDAKNTKMNYWKLSATVTLRSLID